MAKYPAYQSPCNGRSTLLISSHISMHQPYKSLTVDKWINVDRALVPGTFVCMEFRGNLVIIGIILIRPTGSIDGCLTHANLLVQAWTNTCLLDLSIGNCRSWNDPTGLMLAVKILPQVVNSRRSSSLDTSFFNRDQYIRTGLLDQICISCFQTFRF